MKARDLVLRILFLCGFLTPFSTVHAQQLERQDVLPLFQLLGREDWGAAFKSANQVIADHPSDTTDLIGIVNYASILSACALTANGEMTYAKLQKHMKHFVGKRLWMAAHPTTEDTASLGSNTTCLRLDKHPAEAHVAATDRSATTILCFENYLFDEGVDLSGLNGKTTRMGGILTRFETNPNRSRIWIMRLMIEHTSIRKA